MLQVLTELAKQHKDTKICKIVGSACIHDYPDKFCPTLLLYKNGQVMGHIKDIKQFGGMKMTWQVLEFDFAKLGMWKTDIKVDPRTTQRFIMKKKVDGRAKFALDDDVTFGRTRTGGQSYDDSDDDSDW